VELEGVGVERNRSVLGEVGQWTEDRRQRRLRVAKLRSWEQEERNRSRIEVKKTLRATEWGGIEAGEGWELVDTPIEKMAVGSG